MYNKNILSKLIALTKEIRLEKPEKVKGFKSQFVAGNESPFVFRGGIVVTWWLTEQGYKLCRDIVSMSIEKYRELKDVDRDQLLKNIINSFQIICTNGEYFHGDEVFLRKKKNLFEVRAIDNIEVFSKKLWDFMLIEMEKSVGHWFLIYPIPRLLTETVILPKEGIFLLDKRDEKTWKEFACEYPETIYWNPSTGRFIHNKPPDFSNLKYEALLIYLCKGTSDYSRFKAVQEFKILLSVIFALFRIQKKMYLTKSSAQPYTTCIQFKGKENKTPYGSIINGVGQLLPYYIDDYELKADTTKILHEWYNSLQKINI